MLKVKNSLKNFTGAMFSKLGKTFNNEKLARMGAEFENRIQDTAGQISTTKSYIPEYASNSEINRVNTALAEFVMTQNKYVKQIGITAAEVMEKVQVALLKMIEDETTVKLLKREIKKNKTCLQNNILKYFSMRFSVTDKECLKIMKLKPSVEKQRAMVEFSKKVEMETIQEAGKELEAVLNELYKLVESRNHDILDQSYTQYSSTTRIINDCKYEVDKKTRTINILLSEEEQLQKIVDRLTR